jgi:hypothetical protein
VDLTTLRAATWEPGTAVALADACTSTGQTHPLSPRHRIEGHTAQLEECGVEMTVALRSQLLISTTDCTDSSLDAALVGLVAMFSGAAIPLDSMTAPAITNRDQRIHTVTAAFPAAEPLTACDHHVLHQMAAAVYAERHGFRAEPGHTDVLSLRLEAPDPALAGHAFAGLFDESASIAATRSRVTPRPATAPARRGHGPDEAASVRLAFDAASGVITLAMPAAVNGAHDTMARTLAGIARGVRNRLPLPATTRTEFALRRVLTGNGVGE